MPDNHKYSRLAQLISIAEYRKSLVAYLSEKMNPVAPPLTEFLGGRLCAADQPRGQPDQP